VGAARKYTLAAAQRHLRERLHHAFARWRGRALWLGRGGYAMALALALLPGPAAAQSVSDQAISDVQDAIRRLMEGYRKAVELGQQERAMELLHMANETDRIMKQWEMRREVLTATQCRPPPPVGRASN